jgi:hypothetical protein
MKIYKNLLIVIILKTDLIESLQIPKKNPEGRWLSFTYDEILQRDKVILIFSG